jgi:hypothetical protein
MTDQDSHPILTWLVFMLCDVAHVAVGDKISGKKRISVEEGC